MPFLLALQRSTVGSLLSMHAAVTINLQMMEGIKLSFWLIFSLPFSNRWELRRTPGRLFLNIFELLKDIFLASSTFPDNPGWRPSKRKLIYALLYYVCQAQLTLCGSYQIHFNGYSHIYELEEFRWRYNEGSMLNIILYFYVIIIREMLGV